ncbi:DUF6134 family protein [Lacihabitans soyangensis]|uniref:Uncharacterized protein n=1 Tax=Lacihabitans soyangensis TaxID=869394 RepID=A0AAE3H5I8_9BACT|nr:DUF6134 family protein [Lacihabitans soyangensis]MCP9764570.1 hypothetical protein [Lacihabitans soyangensis]
MNKLFLLGALIISSSVYCQNTTEIKKYAIEVAGIKVGEMHATKQSLGKGLVKYHVKSDVKVNLLVYTLKIKYEVISQFDKNGLVYSEAKVNSNKGDFFTTTLLKNGIYEVKSKQEKKEFEKTISSDITWSSSRLFFDEPTNNQKFYAEYYALFNNVKKNKDGTFTCQIENNIDKYVYENQKLVRVIKKNPIKNIELRFITEKVTTSSGI